MPRTTASPLLVASRLLASDQAWLLFVEVPSVAGGSYRLVRASRHLIADGKTWQAAAIEFVLPGENSDGDLGGLSIAIPNASRIPLALVERSNELLGQDITVQLAHEGHLGSFDAGLSWRHRITKVQATESVLRVSSEHPAVKARVPRRVFDRRIFPQLLARR